MIMIFFSCDELVQMEEIYDGQGAIDFSTYIYSEEEFVTSRTDNSLTRGSVTDNNSLNNFGVYAYYTSSQFDSRTATPNYMCNQKVEKNNNNWVYSPVMYWPSSGNLSFFAYSPYGNSSINLNSAHNTVGYPQIKYTVPDNVQQQTDLLVSTPVYNRTKENNGGSPIHLSFKHALSCIGFMGRLTEKANYTVMVKDITIGSLKTKGELKYNNDSFYWEIDPASSSRNYILDKTTENRGLENLDLNNSYPHNQSLNQGGFLMLLLPQKIEDEYFLKITTEFYRNNTVITKVKEVALNTLISELTAGKHYVINVLVSPITDVTLTCEVADWTEKTIDVPSFD